MQTVLVHLFIVFLILFITTSPLYIKSLNIQPSLLVPICGMFIVSIAMAVISGYLNGKQKLIKLGCFMSISALLQLILSISVAFLAKSGAATLYAMAIGALISIIIIYRVYRKENLPNINSIFKHKLNIYKSKDIRKLIRYTILSSIAVLILNILLIFDLLLINSRDTDAIIYTDIYVISRIVYFSSALFIWPFLSSINIKETNQNYKNFTRLVILFFVISGLSILLIYLFGNQITSILLGDTYNRNTNFVEFTIYAIIYKLIFLIITTLTLYFIVLRNYWAVYIPALLFILTYLVTKIMGSDSNTINLLRGLIFSSSIVLTLAVIRFLITSKSSRSI